MKKILLFISLFTFSSAFASTLSPKYSCNNGVFVLREYYNAFGGDGLIHFEAIIKDKNIKRYFNEQGIYGTRPISKNNEVIFDSLNYLGHGYFALRSSELNVAISPEGRGLRIVVTNKYSNSANWFFESCK